MVKSEVSKILAVLAAAYPKFEVDEFRLQLWYEMIKDISYEDAQGGIKNIICNSRFAPTIAEVREETERYLRVKSYEEFILSD